MNDYTLLGSSFLIEELPTTPLQQSGVLAFKEQGQELFKGKVLKAGVGHWEDGVFIPNPIKEGATIYYRQRNDYIVDGVTYKGTNISNVIFYKNE